MSSTAMLITSKFASFDTDSITNIVFTFDEAMKAGRTIKDNAVTLASSFTVVVTSAACPVVQHPHPDSYRP